MPASPLNGVRVLELANFMAGPFCAMVLADLGAEVIKIENPNGGDFSRATGPFVAGESAGFMALNRNKKSLALDLKHPGGRELFWRLVKTADVLIENFRPGTMAELGFDYAAVAAVNARLVYCAASGFGQSGPLKDRAALDLIVQGASGLMSITGEEGRPPVKTGVPIADLTTALFAANAIQAALFERERSGLGQQIDVSLLESALALEVWETSGHFATGDEPEPLGSAHRVLAPYQAVRAADGYVNVGATTPRTWTGFCEALGLPDLEHDPRFRTAADRRTNVTTLIPLIEMVTATRTRAEWIERLERAGVPCGEILSVGEAVRSPQVQARESVVNLPHPRAGTVRTVGTPLRLSRTPARLDRAAPLLGEHTREVLFSLGLPGETVDQLVASGAASATEPLPDDVRRAEGSFVAPGARILGQVRMDEQANLWFGSLLDGRDAPVHLAPGANVQDNSLVRGVPDHPAWLGPRAAMGHNARVLGASVEGRSLIAIGATVLPGAHIGTESIVAANAVVPAGLQVPPRSLVIGHGRIARQVTDQEVARIDHTAAEYLRLAGIYRARLGTG